MGDKYCILIAGWNCLMVKAEHSLEAFPHSLLSFLYSVNSLKNDKAWTWTKGFATLVTLIGLLPSMYCFMNNEGSLVWVSFLTLITFVGSFTIMSSLVASKIGFPTKSFFTLQTNGFSPVCVRCLMRFVLQLKHLSHSLQRYSFSPVWLRWWTSRSELWPKFLPQI